MSDQDWPSIGSGLPDGWVNWDSNHRLDLWALDPSTGISELRLSAPGWSGATIGPDIGSRCQRTYMCPRAHGTEGDSRVTVGDMDEGINTIEVVAKDPSGNDRRASTTPALAGPGLRAQYHDTNDFRTTKVTRVDPQINFNWGTGAPDFSMGTDTFSVRWTGYVEAPETGTYSFQTSTDDGVRLWISDLNAPLINDWRRHGETARTATKYLTAGKHRIVMEYFEETSGAVARLRWRLPSKPITDPHVTVPSDRLAPPAGWQLKIDRGGPQIAAPSGALWERRNQPNDHRDEGLYEPSYSATLTATDGSTANAGTQRSGVKAIKVTVRNPSGAVVLDSPDPEPQGCPGGSCDKTRTFTLYTDSLADGDYTIEVTATDQLGHPAAAPQEWDVTVDRRGDIYTAREYNRNPFDGGIVLATERHKLGTTLARREEDAFTATRRTTTCSQDSSQQCGEVRELSFGRDASDDQSQHLLITRGTSVADHRLDEVSAVRQIAAEDLGEPEANGSIHAVAEPWQQPPPGNNGTYIRQDSDENADTDDSAGQVTRRLYLDAVTRLPIREIIAVNGEVERRLFYTYDRHRLTDAELPPGAFAVERTDPSGTTETDDYATEAPQEPADDAADTEDPSTAQSTEYRSGHGLSTASADIAAAHDPARNANYARSLAAYGVPLTSAEQGELDARDRAIDAAREHIDPYGRGTAASTYGGVWLDHAAGGIIRVSFTQNSDQHLQQIRTFYPYPDRLQASTVSAAFPTLVQVRDAIDADMESLTLEGIQINALYEDIADNSVKVGLEQPNGVVEATLRLRYGPEVTVEQQSAFDPQQGAPPPGSDLRRSRGIPPVYAGLKMYSRHESGAITPCSTAFSMIDASKHRRVLSAGHCSGVNRTWFHADRRIGQTSASDIREYQDPGRRGDRPVSLDVQQIRVRPGYITSRVYARPGTRNAYRQMRRQIAVDEGPQGKEVCTAGYRRTPPRCGRLISTTATVRTQFGLMYRMGLWRFDGPRTLSGDSGGAVYSGGTAYGVHHGLDKNQPSRRAVFTPMPNISRWYGTVVVTPDSLSRLGFE